MRTRKGAIAAFGALSETNVATSGIDLMQNRCAFKIRGNEIIEIVERWQINNAFMLHRHEMRLTTSAGFLRLRSSLSGGMLLLRL